MPKKTTLNELGQMLSHVVKHRATKEDLKPLATREQLMDVQRQVNSIETRLRGMKYSKLEDRVTGLEEKVFGESRG